MAATQTKDQQIEYLKDRFARATSAVLVDFAGLTVSQATDLRNQFRKAGVDYKVVKNTLVKIAVKGTALDTDALKAQLKGQTGIAFSFEEPSVAAKVLRDFRKVEVNAAKLQVKCGVLENAVMAGNRVETELASLPGKNEVRAMLLAQLLAPMQKLVMQLNAPAQNFNFALDARRRQLESGG
jgi:large subunit ribosomal protein L10